MLNHQYHLVKHFTKPDPGEFVPVELLEIDRCAKEKSRENVYLTFHGARMYSDAARLKIYEKTGIFPNLTKADGLASLKLVLEEDTVFPATKSELMEKQGWKVFDLTENEHIHVGMLLGNYLIGNIQVWKK